MRRSGTSQMTATATNGSSPRRGVDEHEQDAGDVEQRRELALEVVPIASRSRPPPGRRMISCWRT